MKIEFCKIEGKHIEQIRKWRNSPEVSKYMNTNDYITVKQQKEWFERIKKDKTKKYWIIKINAKYIGVINLYDIDNRNKRCYWAYYIADVSMRRKGIGRLIELNVLKYVFEVLELNKLCGEVLAFNKIVVEIHKKYGSKVEGYFREHIIKDGKLHDVFCISILKKEWQLIKKNFDFDIIKIYNEKR